MPTNESQPSNSTPARVKEARLNIARASRAKKLAECDWTQIPDTPLSPEQKAAWADYRQALRDLPLTANDEGWVVWPQKPQH